MSGAWLSPSLADDGELAILCIHGERELFIGRWSATENAFTTDDGSTVAPERVAGIVLCPNTRPSSWRLAP